MAKRNATSKKPATPRGSKALTTKQARASRATAKSGTSKPPTSKRPTVKRTRESQAVRRERAERILAQLRQTYPDAECALHHRSAFELLAAVILSAQCTDERVNQVMPGLLAKYPDAERLAAADPAELEATIRSTGFFRNKAKNLIGMSRRVVEQFDGDVPDEMEALLSLPGVARKTANCVLGSWFGKNEGIVVDTHVGRLALRLRLLTSARDDKDAVKIERDLMELLPREAWTYVSHALIDHGRQICQARKPNCTTCPLAEDCPSAGKV